MSVLAGVLKYDRHATVTPDELKALVRHLDAKYFDSQGEIASGHLGMAYRAFWTTPEAHCERQPLMEGNILLAWDGRLDNRDELIDKLNRHADPSSITDVEIAHSLYRLLGKNAFQHLVGDWALSLWDPRIDTLFLARDYIGCRKLFYRLDQGQVVWSSSLEALVQTSGRPLTLDQDYLVQHLLQCPPPDSTPYREIRAVGPAECCTFNTTGNASRFRYWTINPNSQIRYASDLEYDLHFLDLLRTSVAARLRSDRTIVAELSGGLDSSAMVCIADEVARSSGRQIDDIRTLSYFQRVDESADEREFFGVIESLRGRVGIHICLDDVLERARSRLYGSFLTNYFVALPGKVSQSIEREKDRASALSSCGARVVLSGVGGDEFLGGVQYEAPELASYLRAGRIVSFARALANWSKRRRQTYYHLLGECLALLAGRTRPASLVHVDIPQWLLRKPVTHQASMADFVRWADLSPTLLNVEVMRYVLVCQLSVTPASSIGCEEVRWPYLDRRLYIYLASIPREQLLQAGQRRLLMRRALKGLVPDSILSRRTKGHSARLMNNSLREHADEILSLLKEGWMSKGLYDTSLLAERLAKVKDGIVEESMLIRRAVGLELWLRDMVTSGHVRP